MWWMRLHVADSLRRGVCGVRCCGQVLRSHGADYEAHDGLVEGWAFHAGVLTDDLRAGLRPRSKLSLICWSTTPSQCADS